MTPVVDELIASIQQLSPSERDYVFSSFVNAKQISESHPAIVSDENIMKGEPIIAGTKTPVRAIVELWRIGTAPEAIPEHLPHLSLSQIFNALSYYASNRSEINRYIEMNRVPEDLIHPAVRAKIGH